MVGRQKHLVRGRELEEVGSHEPGLDPVSAGHLFHQALGQVLAVLDFHGGHEPRALEVGQLRRVGGRLHRQELRGGLESVVAHRLHERVYQRTLAVGAGPVEE